MDIALEKNALAVIMGGGAGKRLFPLTKMRSKPAVPFGGKYRLVDIPISNCINSGINHMFVLTQFNSVSLHKHIKLTYRFDVFSNGFVELLAAQQTPSGDSWYQGTADAVRQNLHDIVRKDFPYVVILSGDQLYRMDFRRLLEQHHQAGADLTIAALSVPREQTAGLGILRVDAEKKIVDFVEKPKTDAELEPLRVQDELRERLGVNLSVPQYLASMGIYVFSRDALVKALDNDFKDFGHHVIPQAIKTQRVMAYAFKGYWEDIGSIRSFFEANLGLTDYLPRFNFFDASAPIYTHARALPASKVNGGSLKQTVLSDGCIIDDSRLERCVVGLRSIISPGCDLREVVVMGSDYYDSRDSIVRNEAQGIPPIGIGRGCRIQRAIIDKNARIGDGSVISPDGKPSEHDADNYYIRDGIVIIPKNAVIKPGTII
ncbi:MAG: glucose-1-phosphate adenylyltransferase [Elusimicrobiota bacterium]